MGYLSHLSPLKASLKNDKVALRKIKSGDDNHLAEIYKSHRAEFITWLTKSYQCTTEEAKDAYQFAILAFYENVVSNRLVELKSSLKTYLFAIGKNKILELRKSDKRFQELGDRSEEVLDQVDTSELIEREATLELVEQSLEQLGEPCKSLLELYYYDKMTMEDIAETLNYKNAATAKNLKYKCLNRLRKIYENTVDKNK